jgi:hydrogenase expression/formation protein HypE
MTQQDTHVSLAHGNGGRFMRELINELFARHLANPYLDTGTDAAVLPWDAGDGQLVFTTDSFTVQPIEFPGGNIGSLAVHGTTNDLAVAGAIPKYLSLGVLLEEGLEFAVLERVVAGIAEAAREIGVVVAAGDTKVVRRGEGGGIYLNTSGIGVKDPSLDLGIGRVRDGDAVLVSGPIGDHGIAVMLAREQFGLRGDLQSDAASVLAITRQLVKLPGLRFMRDPTRGGLATVAHEIVQGSGLGVVLAEACVPVRDSVQSVCEMLGYDPYFLACEGRVVAVIAGDEADRALAAMQSLPSGRDAALIGRVQEQGDSRDRHWRRARAGGTRGRPAAEDLLKERAPGGPRPWLRHGNYGLREADRLRWRTFQPAGQLPRPMAGCPQLRMSLTAPDLHHNCAAKLRISEVLGTFRDA